MVELHDLDYPKPHENYNAHLMDKYQQAKETSLSELNMKEVKPSAMLQEQYNSN